MRIEWSQDARDELAGIYRYLSDFSQAAAIRTIVEISRRVQQLEQFPQSGRIVDEYRDSGLREVFSGRYRIIYEVSGDTVAVVAVRHGRQHLELP